MSQIYINDLSFTKTYPMKAKSETVDTLNAFIQEVGIPHALHSDDAKELLQGPLNNYVKTMVSRAPTRSHISRGRTEPKAA